MGKSSKTSSAEIGPAALVAIAVACAVLGVSVGCKPQGPVRGPVQGRVTLDDKPVTGAMVLFENKEQGVAIQAPLDGDGRYQVKTYEGEGLPLGSYKVAVTPGRIMQPGEELPLAGKANYPPPPPPAEIPERYRSVATSGLTIEVRQGDKPSFDFDLAKQ